MRSTTRGRAIGVNGPPVSIRPSAATGRIMPLFYQGTRSSTAPLRCGNANSGKDGVNSTPPPAEPRLGLDALHPENPHRGREPLSVRMRPVNAPRHVHPPNDAAEDRVAEMVRTALRVQERIVHHINEEFGAPGVRRLVAGDRNGARGVAEPGSARGFERNGAVRPEALDVQAALNDLNRPMRRLISGAHDAVERGAVVL